MFQSRTHTCNELRLENAGEQVRIVGWMENVREVGQNFAFVVVRDFYGTTQVVIETEDMMKVVKALNKESTIAVEGTVRERASKNPKLPTGDIEVVPTKIEVLGRCRYNELPFEINRSRDADEALRLKYRYLDLRNPAVKQNIILRCQVVAALRAAMTAHGFLEITTPILTASSPEGARDYLVPARKHPGKFYALPQAPQQFKQLLMTAGFDRYFQIAPCFRDEDARGDRSPGEFYQLDMEMAFATQDDVFAVLEDVLPPIFAKYGKYNIASEAPFRRISYRDAMETYGSDKPDLRIDLTVQDMTALVAGSDFAPFAAGNTVKAVVVPDCTMARKAIDKLCADVEVQAGSKPYWFKVDEQGNFAGGIAKFLTDKTAEITAALGLKPGCFVGVTLGRFIPERFNSAIEKGIALCVFYIGLDGVLAGSDTLVAILSMVLGVILGELLDLDGRIHALGDWVERRFAKKQSKTSISEGFVNASLLFCVGAMAIMGALDSGLTGDHATLYAKSTLDGITSIVYGSTMGAGVALSGVAVFLYQGLITLCASFIAPFLSEVVIAEMKCVGSLLIIGLSFNMLGMTKIKVMNYVPAVFFPILLCTFM